MTLHHWVLRTKAGEEHLLAPPGESFGAFWRVGAVLQSELLHFPMCVGVDKNAVQEPPAPGSWGLELTLLPDPPDGRPLFSAEEDGVGRLSLLGEFLACAETLSEVLSMELRVGECTEKGVRLTLQVSKSPESLTLLRCALDMVARGRGYRIGEHAQVRHD